MEAILDKASEKVRNFLNACDAKVIGIEEYDVLADCIPVKKKAQLLNNKGFYNTNHDVIVINTEKAEKTLDRTLLHELGHWSGHKTRLGRKMGYDLSPVTNVDYETEEIIAEMVAYNLGSLLGIMTEDFAHKSENYIATFTKGNIYEAREHAKRATWFLMNLVKHKYKVA